MILAIEILMKKIPMKKIKFSNFLDLWLESSIPRNIRKFCFSGFANSVLECKIFLKKKNI